jgi:hypothetical protein
MIEIDGPCDLATCKRFVGLWSFRKNKIKYGDGVWHREHMLQFFFLKYILHKI